jgi:hypothetical protein
LLTLVAGSCLTAREAIRRLRQYLRTIFDYDRKVVQLAPLFFMNPMGKDHVTALLDAYLAMDGDGIGARMP